MQITFCGTGAASLNAARAGAAIHVEQDGAGLLLDCGPGWLERFLGARLEPERLEAVVLSHLHFDHAMGLAELLTRWTFEGFPLPTIYGPRGIEDYAEQALAYARTQHRYLSGRQLHRLEGAAVMRTPPGAQIETKAAALRSAEVPHASYLECLGWRVEAGGGTMVYSGDTRPAPEVMGALAEGAEVLIHETFTEQALSAHAAGLPSAEAEAMREAFFALHSPLGPVAKLAAETGVPRLILTHLLAEESAERLVAEASAHYKGEILVAWDGMSLEV